MHTRRSFLLSSTGTLLFIATSGYALPVIAEEAPLRLGLVVAKDSSVSDVSLQDIKRLYLGERVNAGSQRLLPLNLSPETRERRAFDKAVLNMEPEVIARYWIDRRIRGESGAPKALDTADLLQRVVARLEGAIGYAPMTAIRPEVKVIRVDGRLPGQSGYPLEF
jgi:hypothetical protein